MWLPGVSWDKVNTPPEREGEGREADRPETNKARKTRRRHAQGKQRKEYRLSTKGLSEGELRKPVGTR